MNDTQIARIILDPPKADLVIVASASWFVWVGFALVIAAVIVGLWPKKEEVKK